MSSTLSIVVVVQKCLTPAVKLELEANPQCQMDQLLGDHIWSLLLPELQQSSAGMKSFNSSSTPFNSRGPSMASSSPLPSPSVGGPQRTHSGIFNTVISRGDSNSSFCVRPLRYCLTYRALSRPLQLSSPHIILWTAAFACQTPYQRTKVVRCVQVDIIRLR